MKRLPFIVRITLCVYHDVCLMNCTPRSSAVMLLVTMRRLRQAWKGAGGSAQERLTLTLTEVAAG